MNQKHSHNGLGVSLEGGSKLIARINRVDDIHNNVHWNIGEAVMVENIGSRNIFTGENQDREAVAAIKLRGCRYAVRGGPSGRSR